MKNAVIIADYGKDTGMGHLSRCATLTKELSDSFKVKFACLNDECFPFVKGYVEKLNCTAVAVDDLTYVGAYVKADVIIIDSYKITTKFLTDIKNYYEVCAVIDDNHSLPFYDTDVVINQNIGANNRVYRARKDTELLLGLEYLMLKDAFAAAKPIDISKDVSNIVVTMGAVDSKKVTEKILKQIAKHPYVFDVVVGPNYGNTAGLEKLASDFDNIKLHHNAVMPEIFSNCQAAVSACGSTIYELAALGIPTIGIVTADNQQNTSIEMENGGIIVSAGLVEKLSEWYVEQLFDDIVNNKQCRKEMHETQLSLIKRDGAKRIKEKLLARFA